MDADDDFHDSRAFAQQVLKARAMKPVDMLIMLGYQPEDVTFDTYLYINRLGQLSAMEKPNRHSYPVDIFENIGYVVPLWSGSVMQARRDLRQALKSR